MELKVGDVLVFVGNEGLNNKHYDNFDKGRQYKISRLESISYHIDEATGYESECVMFENHTHGCLASSIRSYFIKIEDYRNQKIESITG